ncbi:MAG: type III pantothenate kinase, partial [Spirochaetaceae bacterium]|nr:type III pantothenate kinase [Spirochaetaceae bacterium]
MLLVIDIGNTNIVVALFRDGALSPVGRIYTDPKRTGDEYSIVFRSLLREIGVSPQDIGASIVSSVVPALIGPFLSMIEGLTGKKALLVNHALYHLLPVKIPPSRAHQIGTDIVCNVLEAYSRFNGPCIVVDFGTALSFAAIGRDGALLGTAITPGLGIAVQSLVSHTAQLPPVALEAPESTLGANTVDEIQSGIVLGYKGLVESLIGQFKDEMQRLEGMRPEDVRVIATGGLNSVLSP